MLSVKEQIISELNKLTPEQQAQILQVAKQLQHPALPQGSAGEVLLAHMDKFEFAPGAVDEMMQIIGTN